MRTGSVAIVCGGRDFTNAKLLQTTLDRLAVEYGITRIVHGAARGADTLAHKWAEAGGTEVEKYPAKWSSLGPKAGPIRNSEMLHAEKPDLVIAFPGGKGTADMIRKARAAGVTVIEVTP